MINLTKFSGDVRIRPPNAHQQQHNYDYSMGATGTTIKSGHLTLRCVWLPGPKLIFIHAIYGIIYI